MADFPPEEINRRLELLSTDLQQFPAASPCPWPLARIFNELLKQAKRQLGDDPIVRGMRLVEEATREHEPESTDTLNGTVRAQITQIHVALESANGAAKQPPAAARAKNARGSKTAASAR